MNLSTQTAKTGRTRQIDTILRYMASVICPFCGAEVQLHISVYSWQKPLCTNCGWNLRWAQSELANSNANLRLLKILFIVAVVVFAMICGWHSELLGLMPVPLLITLVFAVFAYDYQRRKRAIGEILAAGKTDPCAAGRVPLPSSLVPKILALHRPRRAVLRPAGWIGVLFVAVALAVSGFVAALSATIARSVAPDREAWPLLAVFTCIVAILVGVMVFTAIKERRKLPLLQDGEVATGRVVEQQVIHRGHQVDNQITYEFLPKGNPLIRKTERDHTRKIFEDMLIPVFYDPVSPKNCTALCATYYRLPDAEI